MTESGRKNEWRWRQGRAYADRQNEKVKDYQSSFFGKMALRAGCANSAAKTRGAKGRITSGDLIDLWAKQNGIDLTLSVRCGICGVMAEEWNADHIKPIKDGGAHEPENMQLLCLGCHKAKSREDRDAYQDMPSLFESLHQGSTP